MKGVNHLRKEIESALRSGHGVRCKSPPVDMRPLQRAKSRLVKAMCLDVIYQPVTASHIWDLAPNDAFRRAKRLSSLLNEVTLFGHVAKVQRDLVRISINIWRMHKSAFNGVCRKLRSKISELHWTSPEAVEWQEALTTNPRLRARVHRCTPHRACRGRRCDLTVTCTRSRYLAELALRTVCAPAD